MTLNNSKNWEGASYETPSVKTLEVLSEGVLCASGAFRIASWVEEGDDDALDF
jgi:hypothetical protein